MSAASREFDRARAARALAKADLDTALAQVRGDLAARSVGGRVLDTAVDEAAETAFEAIEVVRANKAVVAGTVGALAAWLLRKPIVAGVAHLIDRIRRG